MRSAFPVGGGRSPSSLDMNPFVESQHICKRSDRTGRWLINIAAALLLIFPNHAHAKKAYRPRAGICGAAVDGDIRRVKAYLQGDETLIHERDRGATVLHWALPPSSVGAACL